MSQEPTQYRYNFVTGEMEDLATFPTTDEEAKQFIPQDASTQGLYEAYRSMGSSIADAAIKTMKAVAGK